eukprot:gnl/MRDRNA2_/MRDRNA2_33697_c0_seq1.p1 gnl/MRDRNA2_/MRDRNA2_33697_c0~~gnl/MRDRNA2_/MRDRNA2_33697_c0_seq1.p1  ORF type:complete len:519 (-),score=68.12 gnl/MRDRNA2_/MRDRNA2_33697_c0_seq1:3-1559(-)
MVGRSRSKEGIRKQLDELDDLLNEQELVDRTQALSLEGLGQRIVTRDDGGIGAQLFWGAMFLGGYCSPSESGVAVKVYLIVWVCSFLLCGTTCFVNLYQRQVPYHLLPADLMVAFVHVPALFSFLFWRRALAEDSDHDETDSRGTYLQVGRETEQILPDPYSKRAHPIWQVLAFIKNRGSMCCWCGDTKSPNCNHFTYKEKLGQCVGLVGKVVLPSQVLMTALVYAGFAYPAWLDTYANPHHHFVWFHAVSMWIVIPFVASCVVTSTAFFGFFIYLHYLEAEMIGLIFKRSGAWTEPSDRKSPGGTTTPASESGSESHALSLPKRKREYVVWSQMNVYKREEDIEDVKAADAIMSRLTESFLHVQDRVDASCASWSVLVILFLSVAFLSLLAALYDFALLTQGQVSYKLKWYVYYVDVFLVLFGLLGTAGFLVFGALLTARMDDLAMDCLVGMRARGVPPHMAYAAYSFLQTGGRKACGFKILGCRVDFSHVVTYFGGLSTLLGIMMANAEYVVEVEK